MSDKLSEEELLYESMLAFGCKKAEVESVRYDIPEQELNERIERINQAEKQIVALIKKPEITEEWIEEKAERFMLQCPGGMLHSWASVKRFIKDFIRSLKEC